MTSFNENDDTKNVIISVSEVEHTKIIDDLLVEK